MTTPGLARQSEAIVARLDAVLGDVGADERRRLVSVTVELDAELDPSAVAFSSRLAGERWFCWEQPERGLALAGLGSAREIVSRGPNRFADVEQECASAVRGAIVDEPDAMPPGAGPIWFGGFAFDPEGAQAPQWASLPPALMVMPEIALARSGDRAFLTAALFAGDGQGDRESIDGLRRRLTSLHDAPLPLRDPSPVSEPRILSARDPGAFEASVAEATSRIEAGDFEKVVLAREVRVEANSAHDPAAVFGALRQRFPSCFCFCVGTAEAAFLGASPELLVRRAGPIPATVALAGTVRRSSDPAVDMHLGEQLKLSEKDRREHEIVARRIERALAPHAVWVERADEPELAEVANVRHLATPIHAHLADARSAVALAGLLHPTPAVGGEPTEAAREAIVELEEMDRGWYAGPVGWMDAAEDGEFCVALRSALLRDRTAHAFAGGGIVAGSDPAAELAETELKLEAIVPLLVG
jgi:salicylate biosynthesis isochorismate synthase/menaquinone-specific isochorismate synthase